MLEGVTVYSQWIINCLCHSAVLFSAFFFWGKGREVSLSQLPFSSSLSMAPEVATSDVAHFVSKITRHKALLSHFFEVFSHCTLSLIPVLPGQSQPNFRLLSITPSCWDWGKAFEMGFLVTAETCCQFWGHKVITHCCPKGPPVPVCVYAFVRVCVEYRATAHMQHQSLTAYCAGLSWCTQPYSGCSPLTPPVWTTQSNTPLVITPFLPLHSPSDTRLFSVKADLWVGIKSILRTRCAPPVTTASCQFHFFFFYCYFKGNKVKTNISHFKVRPG